MRESMSSHAHTRTHTPPFFALHNRLCSAYLRRGPKRGRDGAGDGVCAGAVSRRKVLTTMQDPHPRGGEIGVSPPRDEAFDGTRTVHDPSGDGMGLGRRYVRCGESRLALGRQQVLEFWNSS